MSMNVFFYIIVIITVTVLSVVIMLYSKKLSDSIDQTKKDVKTLDDKHGDKAQKRRAALYDRRRAMQKKAYKEISMKESSI